MSTAYSDLLQLSAPWWTFVLRGLVIYVLVTVLMRMSGKRAMAQVTPFDLILMILIGNTVQNGINGGDNSVTGAFLMAGTLFAINWVVAWGSARSVTFRHFMEGAPTLLAEDGQIYKDVLRRQLVSPRDFTIAMELAGIDSPNQIKRAVLEPNGQILIQSTDGKWS